MNGGDEIDVVAHANFPYLPDSLVPVTRIGFRIRQILDEAIESIAQQRRGIEVQDVTRIEAVFA